MQPRQFDYSDEPTPEYRSEVIKGRDSFYDTPWKRIMAGSAFKEAFSQFSDESSEEAFSDSENKFGRREGKVTWKTFAIH
jgi:hypothetical protein